VAQEIQDYEPPPITWIETNATIVHAELNHPVKTYDGIYKYTLHVELTYPVPHADSQFAVYETYPDTKRTAMEELDYYVVNETVSLWYHTEHVSNYKFTQPYPESCCPLYSPGVVIPISMIALVWTPFICFYELSPKRSTDPDTTSL